jgi:PAS domain S-box-containing protein
MPASEVYTILDRLREGVQIIGRDFRYLYLNETSLRHARHRKEDLLGKKLSDLYPEIENTRFFKELKRSMKDGRTRSLQEEYSYPDGSKAWLDLCIQSIPEGLLVTTIDRTELKQANEALVKKLMRDQYTEALEIYKEENQQSLRYASQLQLALMQEKKDLDELFPDAFVFLRPKNIVSGDFYWFNSHEHKTFLGLGDCTGHGTPGALLTIMGMNILHAAYRVHKIYSPAALLKFLDEDLCRKLSHKSGEKVMSDGMDIALCEINTKAMTFSTSGANGTVYLVRNKVVKQIKTDKYNIGICDGSRTLHTFHHPLQPGDWIYLFSDGYADQFGGPHGKKLGSSRFRELLASISPLSGAKQEAAVKKFLKDWQKEEEQTDDILVMGVRV